MYTKPNFIALTSQCILRKLLLYKQNKNKIIIRLSFTALRMDACKERSGCEASLVWKRQEMRETSQTSQSLQCFPFLLQASKTREEWLRGRERLALFVASQSFCGCDVSRLDVHGTITTSTESKFYEHCNVLQPWSSYGTDNGVNDELF